MGFHKHTEDRISRMYPIGASRADIPANNVDPALIVDVGDGEPPLCICIFRVDTIITFAADSATANTQISNPEKTRLVKANELVEFAFPNKAPGGMYARAATETSTTTNGVDKQSFGEPEV